MGEDFKTTLNFVYEEISQMYPTSQKKIENCKDVLNFHVQGTGMWTRCNSGPCHWLCCPSPVPLYRFQTLGNFWKQLQSALFPGIKRVARKLETCMWRMHDFNESENICVLSLFSSDNIRLSTHAEYLDILGLRIYSNQHSTI